jgi:hypothetical protein
MTITTKEWRRAISWTIAIVALSCIPYGVAILMAPPGWQFAGILVNPLDGHSYMAKMQQGEAGNWLFHLTYTPEPHDGAFIFTFYLALGHLARLFGVSKMIIFHLARLLAGFGLLLVAFRFVSRVVSTPTERKLAFVFILTASGLGWLGVILGAFPIDLWIPEAFVPYSLYANPHFSLAMMLVLIIFNNLIPLSSPPPSSPLRVPPLSSGLWPALAALALAMILPFALLTVWAVSMIFMGWLFFQQRRLPWAQLWLTLSVIVLPAPIILYQYWVSITNPILAGWSAQNVTPAPKLLDFWLGYGLIGLLAIVGAWRVIRPGKASPQGEWFVLLWAVTVIVLIYVPFNLQRRLITGLHLPLCILAAIGLSRWPAVNRLDIKWQRLVAVAVIIVGALGTLLVWSFPLLGMLQSPDASPTAALFFVRSEEQTAFKWLQQQAKADDVILASPRVGMFVPGQTGGRAFYGHPFETIGAGAKKAQVEAFFKGQIDSVTPAADYIFYGPSEQALGQPQTAGLSAVYSSNNITIYAAR